jgi:hypothetical protein
MSLTKTPAEAARDAYFPHPAWEFSQLDEDSHASWVAVAQAAIDTYLAQVAAGLPTVAEMFQASEKETPMRSIHALFAERFAKLQSNYERLKANYLQDWIACEKVLVLAGIDMEPTEDGGKTIEDGIEALKTERDKIKSAVDTARVAIDGARVMMEELQARINMIACERDEFKAERDTLRQKLADEKAANLRNCQDAGRDIDDLNQRLIERTEGFMARLEEKTKRERYVPLEEHEAKMKIAVEALEDCEEYFKDRIDADHDGTRFVGNVESCKYNEVTEALTTLKGTK